MISLSDVRRLSLFDGVGDTELTALIELGVETRFAPGEVLFVEGTPAELWWVLLDGSAELVRHVGNEETRLGAIDVPGRWAGGFRAWDPNGVYLATARGLAAGRMLTVPAPALHDWTATWFPFGEHLIEGLFRTARSFEAVTRQREALVALGTLAAGLAHEINNPAAAAVRAVASLDDACGGLMSSLRELAEGSITAEQFVGLDTLRRELAPWGEPLALAGSAVAGSALAGSPRGAAAFAAVEREEAVGGWLDDAGVEDAWDLAGTLAAAGADVAWCERAYAALGSDALAPGLKWVASATSASSLLSQVTESTRRISELVAAVKSYSQLDRASVQRIDVTEGLDATLTMLAATIPAGVIVERDYRPDVPSIEAIPGELNQVWTNLIGNAIDAMNGAGSLGISTRPDGDGLVVEITDTGTGMSAAAQQHAFEPFFTTKEVGKGTGLGLDISRRIVVDRHGGEISIDSVPGRTVMSVRLPPTPPAAPTRR